MIINISTLDRVLRLFIGSLLIIWGVAGGPWWTYFGLVLLATAAWQFCPIYVILRINTRRRVRPTKK